MYSKFICISTHVCMFCLLILSIIFLDAFLLSIIICIIILNIILPHMSRTVWIPSCPNGKSRTGWPTVDGATAALSRGVTFVWKIKRVEDRYTLSAYELVLTKAVHIARGAEWIWATINSSDIFQAKWVLDGLLQLHNRDIHVPVSVPSAASTLERSGTVKKRGFFQGTVRKSCSWRAQPSSSKQSQKKCWEIIETLHILKAVLRFFSPLKRNDGFLQKHLQSLALALAGITPSIRFWWLGRGWSLAAVVSDKFDQVASFFVVRASLG